MSDFDKTVYSSGGAPGASTPQSEGTRRSPLLMIGGVGCALLLCAILLIGGGSYYFLSGNEDLMAGLLPGAEDSPTVLVETPTTEPDETSTATLTPVATEEATEEIATGEAEPVETETATTEASEPKIGPITFALGITEDSEPISPAVSFQETITEVHAIFEYEGMSADYTWERVWYLDGEEVLRSPRSGAPPETWDGPESGIFDYFINNGGDPLPAGDWMLEIYVEEELLASGDFIIEGAAETEEIAEAEGGTETAPDRTPAPGFNITPPASDPDRTPAPGLDITPAPAPGLDITPAPAPGLSSPTPRPPASSGGGGGGTYKLVYTKWDGGEHDMYVGDTNGNNERFMLNRAAGPSWTPDGQQIFFFGEEGIDRQRLSDGREFVFDGVSNGIIAMVNAAAMPDIEGAVLFQGIDWKQGSARWANVSPDGQKVAFDAKPGGDYRIYFLGTADNQQFRFEIVGEQADWSPDSEKIVYRSGRDGKTGIWISNRDDTGHTLLTNNGSDSFPAWSPDGRTIAFSREEGGNVDIYVMNVDGSNVRRLTDAAGPDTLPTYTPSGDIIFRSARSGSWGIWKMSGSGANQREIIPNAGVGPDWSYSRMDVLGR